jgi:mono/diheme cytochrome c family protein
MKSISERILLFASIFCVVFFITTQHAPADVIEGETLFKQICVACHTIGGGRLIGPDLAGVHTRRPQEWLIRYVKSSQTVIKSGDPYATQLFKDYKEVLMPDNNYSDAQIVNILEYVAANSPEGGSQVSATSEPEPITDESIRSGGDLFMGKAGFENGGPTCISCHNVDRAGIIAGGALAMDLTNTYTRLGQAGVRAVIGNAPFPAMSKAFDGKQLTAQEVVDVAAFLQHVDTDEASRQQRHYLPMLMFAGAVGALVLMTILFAVWLRAKKRSVNHAIYERQVKSTWQAMG